jgi:arginine repressor
MNRKRIIEIILSQNKYNEEQKEIIERLEESMIEWETAKSCFQQVNDPKLIDFAIYKEDEAKSKYVYFLSQAKSKGITLDASYMIEELSRASKW